MNTNRYQNELLDLLLSVKNKKLLHALLADLLTPAEWDDIVQRWQIVKRLHARIPQRTIARQLKLSITKITRGSRMLLNPKGGFNQILKKYD